MRFRFYGDNEFENLIWDLTDRQVVLGVTVHPQSLFTVKIPYRFSNHENLSID